MADLTNDHGEIIPSRPGLVVDADALTALTHVVSTALDFMKIREEERTKRTVIKATEQVRVRQFRAAEETLKLYFDQVFAERERISADLFARLDRAFESGDAQMVTAVIGGIVGLAQSSPLAGLGDFGKFWKQLGTPEDPVEL